jgi:hypothetical protein
MRHLRSLIVAGAVLAMGGVPASTWGQHPEDSTEPPLIDLAFKGGTALEYAEAIKQAAGGANIVVMPEAADVPIPAVQLTNASIDAAAYLLDNHVSMRADGRVVLKVELVPVSAFGERQTIRIAGHTADVEVDASIWGVSDIIANAGLERPDLLAAVETALEVIGDTSSQPIIRFHEATDLLIIRGTERQREAVEHVLDELRRMGIEAAHSPVRLAEQQIAEARRVSQQDLEARQGLEARLMEAEARSQEAAQRAAEVDVDAERLRVRIEALQAMLEQRDMEIAALRAEADALRSTISTLNAQVHQMTEAADRNVGSSNPR